MAAIRGGGAPPAFVLLPIHGRPTATAAVVVVIITALVDDNIPTAIRRLRLPKVFLLGRTAAAAEARIPELVVAIGPVLSILIVPRLLDLL